MRRAVPTLFLLFLVTCGVRAQNALELRAESGIGYWIHRIAPTSSAEFTSYEHTRHSLYSGIGLGYYFGKDWKIGPRLAYWMLFDTYMIGPRDNEFILDRHEVGDPFFGAAFAGLHAERIFGGVSGRKLLMYAEPGIFQLYSIHPQNDAFERRFQIEAGLDLLLPSSVSEDHAWMLGIAYRQSMFRSPDAVEGDRHRIYFFGLQFGYRW